MLCCTESFVGKRVFAFESKKHYVFFLGFRCDVVFSKSFADAGEAIIFEPLSARVLSTVSNFEQLLLQLRFPCCIWTLYLNPERKSLFHESCSSMCIASPSISVSSAHSMPAISQSSSAHYTLIVLSKVVG